MIGLPWANPWMQPDAICGPNFMSLVLVPPWPTPFSTHAGKSMGGKSETTPAEVGDARHRATVLNGVAEVLEPFADEIDRLWSLLAWCRPTPIVQSEINA